MARDPQSPEQQRWYYDGIRQRHAHINAGDASLVRWWLTLPVRLVRGAYRLARGRPLHDGPENVWERKRRERKRRVR